MCDIHADKSHRWHAALQYFAALQRAHCLSRPPPAARQLSQVWVISTPQCSNAPSSGIPAGFHPKPVSHQKKEKTVGLCSQAVLRLGRISPCRRERDPGSRGLQVWSPSSRGPPGGHERQGAVRGTYRSPMRSTRGTSHLLLDPRLARVVPPSLPWVGSSLYLSASWVPAS